MTKAVKDMTRDELLELVGEMAEAKATSGPSNRLADYEIPEVPLALRIMKPILIIVGTTVVGGVVLTFLIAAITSFTS